MVNNPQLYPKAYFNWMRLKWAHDPKFSVEPWQVEDYRELSIETLLNRLTSLGLPLQEENFILAAENQASPEELTRFLWPRPDNEMPIYLLIFELWRRLLPEKTSLSIVCDELDHRIGLYFKDRSQNHGISNALQRLEEILEESTEAGEKNQAVFATLTRHVAHDVEGFLFDYISDLIDARNDLDAAELIRIFYPYVSDAFSFDFLKARLLILMDSHEGNLAFIKLLEHLAEKPSIDLLLETSAFLIHHGDPSLFQKAARLTLDHVTIEEDFQELLAIVADYCHFVEKEQTEQQIQKVFAARLKNAGDAEMTSSDPDLMLLRNLLDDPDWTKI